MRLQKEVRSAHRSAHIKGGGGGEGRYKHCPNFVSFKLFMN